MAEPSAEIVQRAQQGDPEALTQLIISQQHYVYSISMSVLRNAEDAADLTQEAFVRLMRVLPQYSGESRFTTWLYRMVVNLGRDELRRRGRRVQVVTPAEDDDLDPLSLAADEDRTGDPLRALELGETRGEVRRALEQIEDHYRLALTLYYFDDLKYTDIAEVLGLPLNTVKSHIRRGKERLLQLLEAEDTPQPLRAREVAAPQPAPRSQPPAPRIGLLTRVRGV